MVCTLNLQVTIGSESDMQELRAQQLSVARIFVFAPPGGQHTQSKNLTGEDETMDPVTDHSGGKPCQAKWESARLDKFLNNLSKHLTMVENGNDVTAKVVELLSRGCKNADTQGMEDISRCLQQSCAAHPAVLRLLSTISTAPGDLEGIKKVPARVQELTQQATKTFLDGLPPVNSHQTTLGNLGNPGSPAADQPSTAEQVPKLLKNLSKSLTATEEDSSAVVKVARLLSKACQKYKGDRQSLQKVMVCLHEAAQSNPSIRKNLLRLVDSSGPSTDETIKVSAEVRALTQQALLNPIAVPTALIVSKPPTTLKGAEKDRQLRVKQFVKKLDCHLQSLPDSTGAIVTMLNRASANGSGEGVKKIVSFLHNSAMQDPSVQHHLEMLATTPEALGLNGPRLSPGARAIVEKALVTALEDTVPSQEADGADVSMAPEEPQGGEEDHLLRPKQVERFCTTLSSHLATMGSDPHDAKKVVFMLAKASNKMRDADKSRVTLILQEGAAANATVLELLEALAHRPQDVQLKRKIPPGVRGLAMQALGMEPPPVACDAPVVTKGGSKAAKRAARGAQVGKPGEGWSPEQVTRFMGKLSVLLSSTDDNSGKGAWKMAHMMHRGCSNTGPSEKIQLAAFLRSRADANPAVKQHLWTLAHGPHSFGRKRPVPPAVQMLALWALEKPAVETTTAVGPAPDVVMENPAYGLNSPAQSAVLPLASGAAPPVV